MILIKGFGNTMWELSLNYYYSPLAKSRDKYERIIAEKK